MIDFAADTGAIMDGPLGADAIYTPVGGDPAAIRVIPRQPDVQRDWGETRISRATTTFLLAVADVALPAEGDTIEFDSVTYVVQGAPERDERRLRWTVETRPA